MAARLWYIRSLGELLDVNVLYAGSSQPVRSSQEITNACKRRRLALEWCDQNVVKPNEVVTQTEENETDGVLTQIQVDQGDVGGGLGASEVGNTFDSSTEGD
ncbi:hypothetical protein R6Q59_023386 [Mikania micrantha]